MAVSEKVVPLHPLNENGGCRKADFLGYGVMVTLQILVLPFLVRVRVPQQINCQVVDSQLLGFFISRKSIFLIPKPSLVRQT